MTAAACLAFPTWLAVAAAPAAAQMPASNPRPDSAPARPPSRGRLEFLVGIHVGAPAKYAFATGLGWLTRHTDSESGYALMTETGLGAGRASVGVVDYDMMGTGGQFRVSVLRTWRRPWKVAPNQTFVGPELRYAPLGLLTVGVGYYWRVAGHAPGDARFFAPTVGFLF